MRASRALAVTAAACAAVVLSAPLAGATNGPMNVTVNPESVHQGGTIRISVEGCGHGGSVTSNAFPRTQLPVNPSGRVSATARIHDFATPGRYNLVVRCDAGHPVGDPPVHGPRRAGREGRSRRVARAQLRPRWRSARGSSPRRPSAARFHRPPPPAEQQIGLTGRDRTPRETPVAPSPAARTRGDGRTRVVADEQVSGAGQCRRAPRHAGARRRRRRWPRPPPAPRRRRFRGARPADAAAETAPDPRGCERRNSPWAVGGRARRRGAASRW